GCVRLARLEAAPPHFSLPACRCLSARKPPPPPALAEEPRSDFPPLPPPAPESKAVHRPGPEVEPPVAKDPPPFHLATKNPRARCSWVAVRLRPLAASSIST